MTPHSTGGMNNTFKYRNLSLSVYVDYALGHSVYNYMYTRGLQTRSEERRVGKEC